MNFYILHIDLAARRTEVILTSIRGSLADLTFGSAVRAGDDEEVIRLLSTNGLDLLLAEVSFDIVLDIDTRLTPPIIRRHDAFENTANGTNSESKSQHGFMTVTPFHLGILAQRRHIIKIMIEKILEVTEPQKQFQWMNNVLASKTTLIIPEDAVPCDKGTLSLNGMNSFHVAARYHSKSLKYILCVLNEKQWMPELRYLLEETDSFLHQTPLHLAAKNPTPEVARCHILHHN